MQWDLHKECSWSLYALLKQNKQLCEKNVLAQEAFSATYIKKTRKTQNHIYTYV